MVVRGLKVIGNFILAFIRCIWPIEAIHFVCLCTSLNDASGRGTEPDRMIHLIVDLHCECKHLGVHVSYFSRPTGSLENEDIQIFQL